MSKIPLYSYCTPSHEILRDQWFLHTVGDEYDVRIRTTAQVCNRGSYQSKGWNECMWHKTRIILDAIEECDGQIFVFSDIDVQFLGESSEYLLTAIADCDIAFQANSDHGDICAGFFVCRASQATRDFWHTVQSKIDARRDDQVCANRLLCSNWWATALLYRLHLSNVLPNSKRDPFVYCSQQFGIRWKVLGQEVWLPGKRWSPGQPLHVPENILVHHANWTIGIENKIAQLRYVRDIMQNRSALRR